MAQNKLNPAGKRLLSIPGMGPILASVAAAEIDQIGRFESAEKLCAYAGLVPMTHSSGGKTYNGALLSATNGCAGHLSKRPGWRWAARATSEAFTSGNAPAARPLSCNIGRCPARRTFLEWQIYCADRERPSMALSATASRSFSFFAYETIENLKIYGATATKPDAAYRSIGP